MIVTLQQVIAIAITDRDHQRRLV